MSRLKEAQEKVRGYKIQRRSWPELQPGEFVYYVKNRTTGELKHVAATTREQAEHIAFPDVAQDLLRSMPYHSYKESKKEEQKDG